MNIEGDEIDSYNYAHFTSSGDRFEVFRTTSRVGSNAPDFTGTLLATGESMPISAYWQERDVLIEFGSLT